MRTTTRTQLGGSSGHRGPSDDGVMQARDAHLDPARAAGRAARRWQHPVKGTGWYRQAEKNDAALPEY